MYLVFKEISILCPVLIVFYGGPLLSNLQICLDCQCKVGLYWYVMDKS